VRKRVSPPLNLPGGVLLGQGGYRRSLLKREKVECFFYFDIPRVDPLHSPLLTANYRSVYKVRSRSVV